MSRRVVIGTRGSELALWQTAHVARLLADAAPDWEVQVEILSTKGDRIVDRPLAKIGGKGLFTEELEHGLLSEALDLAVHSLKDLPTESPGGLALGAVPERATPYDALVSTRWSDVEALPRGARVGTSSLRRKAQLLALRNDLEIVDLRGNVPTRVGKVEDGSLDAAILACAGLERLDMAASIRQVLPEELMLPAPAQGALGLQIRANDSRLHEVLELISSREAVAETTAERTMLAALGGGCQVPIGALARVDGDTLALKGCVCTLDGARILRVDVEGTQSDAEDLGRNAAQLLLDQGAGAIIEESRGHD